MNKDIEEELEELYALKYMIRFNNIPRITDETVIEHTGFVCIIIMRLSRIYRFDISRALQMAAIHDAHEIYLSDVPRNVKNAFPLLDKVLKEVEEAIIKEKFPEYEELLKEFEECKTIEALIVKLADIYSVNQYAKVEVKLGSKFYMPQVVEDSGISIKELKKILEEYKK